MPGYQRFVAYVYEYRKGKKEENCGFIRVEAREETCRVEVHVKCPGLPADALCELKGIVRSPKGTSGVTIGTCRTIQDGIQCLVSCPTDDMDQHGTGLVDLGGLILLTEEGAFFGTEWDDVPIVPQEFIPEKKRESEISEKDIAKDLRTEENEPKERNEETITLLDVHSILPPINKEKVLQDISADTERIEKDIIRTEPLLTIEEQKEKQQKTGTESQNISPNQLKQDLTATEYRESSQKEKDDLSSENHEEKTIPEEAYIEESEKSQPFEKNESMENTKDNTKDNTKSSTIWNKEPNIAEPEEDRYSQISRFSDMPSSSERTMPSESIDLSGRNLEKQMPEISKNPSPAHTQNNLPGIPYEPFPDGEISECRKIQPRDMYCLSPNDRSLRNNRFLAHGYYNFGHILLGKNTSGQYILGVPGGYDQQERFMAGMHGFPYFKESPEIRLRQVRGGYWYRLINTPNPHNRNRF